MNYTINLLKLKIQTTLKNMSKNILNLEVLLEDLMELA